MSNIRKIIHIDLDAFFCAVEELHDPSLRGKPFAVGGSPTGRGVVASCSYPARQFGVHSAMPMGQALRLCPQLIVVRSRHSDYSAVSRQVMARLRALTPLVEQLSIDEAFLDVTGLGQPATLLARQLQQTIREDLDLPCSLGVATNKLVAKIANNVGKAQAGGSGPPNAIQVVPPGQEAPFLAPLPCEELWGVGPKTAARLHELGMETIGDIARFPEAELERLFGKHGRDLARRAKGIDDRPVTAQREAKSVSQETTFSRDVSDGAELRQTLRRLSGGVARRLQRKRLAGSTVKLKLRWSDFTTPTRQTTLRQPIDDAGQIYDAVLKLFEKLWRPGQAVRLLGVGVTNLDERPYQPQLWDMETEEFQRAEAAYEKERKLREVMEALNERYGETVMRRGSEFGFSKS